MSFFSWATPPAAELFHEIAGIVVAGLAIGRHYVARAWSKAVFRGNCSIARVCRTTVVFATLVAKSLQILSGIVVSMFVFPFFPIEFPAKSTRKIHLLLAYRRFVLMGLRAGGYWRGLVRKLPGEQTGKTLWALAGLGVFSYGIYAFIQRKFPDSLSKKAVVAFLDRR